MTKRISEAKRCFICAPHLHRRFAGHVCDPSRVCPLYITAGVVALPHPSPELCSSAVAAPSASESASGLMYPPLNEHGRADLQTAQASLKLLKRKINTRQTTTQLRTTPHFRPAALVSERLPRVPATVGPGQLRQFATSRSCPGISAGPRHCQKIWFPSRRRAAGLRPSCRQRRA